MNTLIAAATAALVLAAAPATAGIVYMTGTSNPWGQTTEDSAMDAAFGAGNWTKINGFSTSALTGNSFVYLDGGDGISTEFNAFVAGNLPALESFVTGGGKLVMNAARWDQPNLTTIFGTSLTQGYSSNAQLTAAGTTAGLAGGGAGSSWTGNYFSHDVVSGGTCLVNADSGCAFAVGTAGAGAWGVGGQTAPYFQSTGGLQLRANELSLVNGLAGAVPEASTWTMMIVGFGLVGVSARRRKVAVAA